jgi:hypothetical protein
VRSGSRQSSKRLRSAPDTIHTFGFRLQSTGDVGMGKTPAADASQQTALGDDLNYPHTHATDRAEVADRVWPF